MDSVRHPTPRLSASHSLGVDGMPRKASNTLVHPSPLLLASPFTGVDGRLCREGGSQQQSIPLPADPRSPLRPPRGPVSYEMGHVPAIPQLIHRERSSFACMKVVSPVGSEPASKYETAPASKKSRCHTTFRPYHMPLARHAPVADAVADPSSRCSSPGGPSTRQPLRPCQRGQNRRLHYTPKRYPSNHCPSPCGPSTRQISPRTPRHHQPNGLGRRRGGSARWSC
jgi:hypothetical protein